MVRVPNTETAERRHARREREAILAEQREFLASFDRQVADLTARDAARAIAPSSDKPKGSGDR